METRDEIILALEDEFKHWDELITQLPQDKWTFVIEGYNWTFKDVLAHLMSWMQVSNARLSAGVLEVAPDYPKWLADGDPDTDSDELTNIYNARIYETYQHVPRQVIIDSWRDGFLTLIKTIDDLSDEALFHTDKFAWLPGHALIDVLEGVRHHHAEHNDEQLQKMIKR